MSGHRRGRGGGGHEEANAERWLLTYADMITLLLALFIVLFAVSTINEKKFLALELGLTQTFNPSAVQTNGGSGLLNQSSLVSKPGTNPSPTPVLAGSAKPTPQRAAQVTANLVAQALKAAKLQHDATVAVSSQGVVVQVLADRVFFGSDSASLGALGERVVDVIASIVAPMPNDIEVEGFTDDQPIEGGPYSSNWELSSARAANVVNRLNVIDHVSANRLSSVGFGATHFVTPNTSAAREAENRRIDVVILNT